MNIPLPPRLHTLLARILLPTPHQFQITSLVLDDAAERLMFDVTPTRATAACPLCATPATRIHSRYWRTLQDLPCAAVAVCIRLHVRRFFCGHPTCARRIFAERLPDLVAPAARRTQRLTTALRQIGLALGGAAGTRLAKRLTLPTSRDTLLRLVRSTPLPVLPPPRAVGVDEWALCRGHTYGTILVDLERHHPLDLLADHAADTFAQWLQAHPSVAVVSRDRAGAYAEGATVGAPQAMQVADRFHLVKNLGDTLIREFERHTRLIEHVLQSPAVKQVLVEPPIVLDHATITPLPVHVPPAWMQQDTRRTRYAAVQALHQRGLSQSAIAHHVHLDRKTVRKYVQADGYPARQRRAARRSMLDPYKPYIVERWNAGCHNSAQLWREITMAGFPGKASLVKAYVAQLRHAASGTNDQHRQPLAPTTPVRQQRRPSLRDVTRLVLQRPETRRAADDTLLAAVSDVHPAVAAVMHGAQVFVALVRERRADDFDAWNVWAAACDSAAMRGFAASLRRDAAAVQAALRAGWNNGQTEGHVNRLKMLKRQMFGRAKLDLLRQRFLATALDKDPARCDHQECV